VGFLNSGVLEKKPKKAYACVFAKANAFVVKAHKAPRLAFFKSEKLRSLRFDLRKFPEHQFQANQRRITR